MPDNDNPNTLDQNLTDTTQQANKAAESTNNISEKINILTKKTDAAGESLKKAAVSMNDYSQNIGKAAVELGAFDEKQSKIQKNTEEFSNVISKLGPGPIKDVLGHFSGLGDKIFNVVKGSASAFLIMESAIYKGLVDPLQPAETTIGMFGKKIAELNESFKNLLSTQQVSRVGFIRLGSSISESNIAAELYPNTLRRIAASHGIATKEINDMMSSLQGIPAILNQNEKSQQDIIGTQKEMMDTNAQMIEISRTFGMTSAEATQKAMTGYREFGQVTEDTIKVMATMSAASKQTGIDRRIADEQIQEASRGLTIFGQRADAAANTWATFMSSLKDTIPINQVGELTKQVTNSIAGMSIQNRAFIGMMSGISQGRSALGGALQLEVAMRTPEGMQQNLQALTSTLSQFAGGKIITLEEAARNPQLEIQFQMQREMLSKVANISDPQAQNRILEVLQDVQRGGMSQVDGANELKNLQEEGKSVQDKQLTFLEKIVQNTAIFAQDITNSDQQLTRINEALQGRIPGRDVSMGIDRMRQSVGELRPTENVFSRPEILGRAMGDFRNDISNLGETLNKLPVTIEDSFKNLSWGDIGKSIVESIKIAGAVINMDKEVKPIEGMAPSAVPQETEILSLPGPQMAEVPPAPGLITQNIRTPEPNIGVAAEKPIGLGSPTNINVEIEKEVVPPATVVPPPIGMVPAAPINVPAARPIMTAPVVPSPGVTTAIPAAPPVHSNIATRTTVPIPEVPAAPIRRMEDIKSDRFLNDKNDLIQSMNQLGLKVQETNTRLSTLVGVKKTETYKPEVIPAVSASTTKNINVEVHVEDEKIKKDLKEMIVSYFEKNNEKNNEKNIRNTLGTRS